MVLFEPQEFGGLEEYATTLAVGLRHQGHQISVLSISWTPPENQYYRRLHENQVPFVQLPKWMSLPVWHRPTQKEILAKIMWLLSPLTFLLTWGLFLFKRRSLRESQASAYGWLHRQLWDQIFVPDRRKPLAVLLLGWWHFCWRPDVLHIQGYTSSLLFVIDWAFANAVPVIYEEHQTPDTQFDWWQTFQHSINKAAIVVAVSEKSAEALRTVCRVVKPIAVRSPLLPDPLVSGQPKDHQTRSNTDSLVVTTVARLYVTKGLNHLVDAIAKVKTVQPQTQFKVYGDGPLREELLAHASSLGLNGPEIFVGAFTHRDELSTIMAQTDIFVMSSILEGQPLSLVEAMAYGCPIVATSVGGIPELIQDGVNGLLCPPGDSDCLARNIRLLIEEPSLRQRLGRAARVSYEHGPFQPVSVCTYFVTVYETALGRATRL
ncbi:MAG TPA: glycosyltransferase family 4 protein [Aggregatilineales bacterium]|nr:glycosyltransferase family 4 protein [Aggregatilineales bacterium]